jgi:hypothetical protein
VYQLCDREWVSEIFHNDPVSLEADDDKLNALEE